MRREFFIGAFLFLICLVVFSPVYHADFIHWDDDLNITGNPHIKEINRENLRWMFTDFAFMRRYVPMSWLTWGVTAHIFGLNPRAFHLEGLLLHAINAVLLFVLLKKILSLASKEQNGTHATIAAAAGALLWAIHPLRVEVVAWANCQMYAQSLLLLMLSTLVYLRAVARQTANKALIFLSAFLFLLSLLSYPTGIAFVAVLLILDIFLLRRLPMDPRRWFEASMRPLWLEKVPFIIATVAVAGVTLWARSHLSEFWKTSDRIAEFGWASRLAQAFYIWAYYAWKPWVSFEWSPVYTQLVSFRVTDWPFVLSSLAVVGVTILLFAKRARWPWAFALWQCHLLLLIPMLGLTEHPHYPNDRYNYIAAIVWSVLIAWVVQRLFVTKWKPAIALLGLFAVTLSVFSFQQTKIWRNSETLFGSVLTKLGREPYRADIYWRLGKTQASDKNIAGAIENFSRSLELAPASAPVHVSLAEAYLANQETNAALKEYELAVKYDDRNALAHYNLGVLLEQQNKSADALPHLQKATEIDPNNADALNSLSRCLAQSGQIDQAMKAVRRVLELDPGHPFANFNLGNALMQQRKIPEALDHFVQAVKSKPDFADAHSQLGTCLAMSGHVGDALPHFVEAARLKPNPATFLSIGMASAQSGKFNEAVKAYKEALRMNPDFVAALMNLGWILASHHEASLRNGGEALGLAKHAVELTNEKDPESLDLLAAAYAECQKFPEAATAISKAISLASAKGQENRTTQLQARLELYRTEKPLRQ
jgi:tetratricopeptide (TPR) repeat protein